MGDTQVLGLLLLRNSHLALGGWLLDSGGNLSRISFQCDPHGYMVEQQTKESTLVLGEGCVWILKFVTLHTI